MKKHNKKIIAPFKDKIKTLEEELKVCGEDKKEEVQNEIAKVKEEMNNIISRNSDIIRKVVPVEEARVLYEAMGNQDRLDLIKVELRNNVTVFFCENVCNTMGGVLAPSTGFIKNFDIVPFRKGFVLVLPQKEDITKMPEWQASREHANENPHQYTKLLQNISLKMKD